MAWDGSLSAPDAAARTLAVAGGLAVVAAAFLPWTSGGIVALDLGVPGWEPGGTPTVAMLLLGFGSLPALAAVAVGWVWPRLIGAAGTAAIVLAYLATGTTAGLTTGVWTALGGAVALLLSSGVGPARR